jgi:hypothetical protein
LSPPFQARFLSCIFALQAAFKSTRSPAHVRTATLPALAWLASHLGWEGRVAAEVVDQVPELVRMLLDAGGVGHGVQEWLAPADEQGVSGIPAVGGWFVADDGGEHF